MRGLDPRIHQKRLRQTLIAGSSPGNDNRGYSGFTPAVLITLAHLSVSRAISAPNSAEPMGVGTPPRSVSRAVRRGSLRPALISRASRSTMSAGVPLGTTAPDHVLTS